MGVIQEYRDLLWWIESVRAKVTSETLPRDVGGCEALMQRHLEYGAEIRHAQTHQQHAHTENYEPDLTGTWVTNVYHLYRDW